MKQQQHISRISNAPSRGLLAGGALVLATMIWGLSFVAVKDSLDVVPPLWMIALRFTIASAVLAIVFFKRILAIKLPTLYRGFVVACFVFAAYIFQTIGIVYTTAGKNAFLTTVYVIITPLAAWIFTKKRPGRTVFFASIIALAGIGLISLHDDLSVNIGDVLTLICGIFFALQICFITIYTQDAHEDPITLTVLQMFFCAVLGWIFAAAGFDRIAGFEGGFPVAIFSSGRTICSLLYLAVFSSSAAFLLQSIGQAHVKSSTASLLLSLEAVFGAIASRILLGEVMAPRAVAGCALIFFAILLSETQFKFLRPKSSHSRE
jgi:drug/metabolite transporter (DMT)-like permease